MSNEMWLKMMSDISPTIPVDLDADLFDDASPLAPAHRPEATTDHAAQMPPSADLWATQDDTLSYIGIRVTQPRKDCVQVAFRLAAVAVERNVIPIIITTLGQSGFESLGFRTERLHADTTDEQRVQEAEITAFWNLAIIVDVQDVGLLG